MNLSSKAAHRGIPFSSIVCANVVVRRLPKLGLPEGVKVIVQDRTLSKGGIEMLGWMLRRSHAGEGAESLKHER